VKTYGKWVTDLGDEKSAGIAVLLISRRTGKNVDGKYWFPNYARSDETLHFKDSGDVPVRVVIKWSEYKPLAAPVPATPVVTVPEAVAKPKP